MRARPAAAIGRLSPNGPWLGFAADGAGFHLVCSRPGDAIAVSTSAGTSRLSELVAVAIVYFEEALEPPPPEIEATQADLAGLMGWMANQADGGVRRLLHEALDAIDDGLAGDSVVARLSEVRAGFDVDAAEQADAIDLLASRMRDPEGWSAAGEAAPSV
jgi:hypothetical protein